MQGDVMDVGESEREVASLRVEVAALRARLEQTQQGMHGFVAMLAHELRTPLGAILMWAHVLRLGRENDREAALDAIEESARTQSKLIGTLLDVTRAVAGRLRIERLPVDLKEIARAVVADLTGLAESKNVRLRATIPAAPLSVRGDAARLGEMVATLARTAVSACPPGGTVDVELERLEQTLRVVVRDSGPGLAAGELATVFTPFHLAGATDQQPLSSLRLELPLVSLLAQLHGGQALAFSPGAGQGTTFALELPGA
jgi:signal transduction histidine kinase